MSMNLAGIRQLGASASGWLGNGPGTISRVYFGQSVGSGTTSETYLYNGINASTNPVCVLEAVSPAKQSDPIHSDIGILFPSGCYYVTDANCAGGVLVFDTEK